MISLKPPVVPSPSIGGAPKADTTAPRTSLPAALANCRGDGVGRQVGPRRSAKALSMTYIEPRFGRVGVQDQRLAGDADRVRDARRVAGRSLRCGPSPSAVRSTEAESGNCTLSSR